MTCSFFPQHLYMCQDTFSKPIQSVTAFQHRYDAALAEFLRKLHHYAGNGGETCRGNVEHSEQVVLHSIKPRANQNEIWLEISCCGNELGLKSFYDLCITWSRVYRHVLKRPCTL